MSWLAVIDSGQVWLTTALLLAARLGGLLLMTPPIGAGAIPPTVRVSLVFALAAALSSALPIAPPPSLGLAPLIFAAAGEVALGATMGLGIGLAFSAFAIGARVLDIQIGFGLGQVFDPVTRTQLPVLSGIVGQLAIVVFFLSDAHLAVLRGLAIGVERFPPGQAWPPEAAFGPVLHQASAAFSLGFALVVPVVFCLALIDLGLGILARNLPQMNMFVVGVPVKIIAGVAALSLWIVASAGIVGRIHASIFAGWEALFR